MTSWPAQELHDAIALSAAAIRRVRSPGSGYGEFWYTVLDGGSRIRIERADPRVLISGELVRQALAVGPHHTLAHNKLTILGCNRKVIYLIGGYLPEIDCYVAEWPD